jgi:uncharacterized membrane protein (UPF0127 family)
MKTRATRIGLLLGFAALLPCAGCEQVSPCCDPLRNDLTGMETARMSINGNEFEVWLATTPEERELGLMNVGADELQPTEDGAIRGMLFVFAAELPRGFWMLNTPTALDIAYLRADGTIVTIWTMEPFDTSTYPSGEPVQYALEVPAGTFAALGITEGDVAVLPAGV